MASVIVIGFFLMVLYIGHTHSLELRLPENFNKSFLDNDNPYKDA